MMQSFPVNYFFNLQNFEHASIFADCENVWEAISHIKVALSQMKLGRLEGQISDKAFLEHPDLISIGKETIVEAGAYIRGPCVIGSGCTIRHGAYIRGDFICGNRCVIGHDTEIKNALFLDDVHAAHFAYLGDSILGNRVNLGAGTKCANLKLDRSEISVYLLKRMGTGLKKFGAIIGDDSQTGCNVVTNPGTMLGKSVLSYPNLNFGGFIPSGKVLKSNVEIIQKDNKSYLLNL